MDGCYFTGYDPATLRLGPAGARCWWSPRAGSRRWSRAACARTRSSAAGSDRGEQFDLSRLRQRPDHVIVTDGARGGTGYEAAPVPGPVVDTYGAGDTFVAGVLFGLASGWPLDRDPRACRQRAPRRR